jgi:hypothetical protein
MMEAWEVFCNFEYRVYFGTTTTAALFWPIVLVISFVSGVEPLPQSKARDDQPVHVELRYASNRDNHGSGQMFHLGLKTLIEDRKKDTSLETGGVLLFSDIRRRRKTEARKQKTAQKTKIGLYHELREQ